MEYVNDEEEWKKHHPWCNYFMRKREGCKMCEGLFKDYPVPDDGDMDKVMKEHFPDNVRVR